MSAVQLMSTLTAEAADLPADVARAALLCAQRANDTDLLARLAAAELPDDVVAAVAARTEAKVRAAYLARPGLDPEVRAEAFATEKRATVLAALAGDPSTPAEILSLLAEDTRPSVRFPVIANTSTPEPLRAKAIRAVAENWNRLNSHQIGVVYDAVVDCPSLHDEFASSPAVAASPALWRALMRRLFPSPHLRPETISALIQLYVSTPAAEVAAARTTWERDAGIDVVVPNAIELAKNPTLRPSQMDALRTAIRNLGLGERATTDALARLDGSFAGDPVDRLLAEIPTASAGRLTEIVDELPRAAGTQLPGERVREVAVAVFCAEAATPEALVSAVNRFRHSTSELPEVFARRAWDRVGLAAVATRCFGGQVDTVAAAAACEGAGVDAAVEFIAAAANSGTSHSRRGALLTALRCCDHDPAAVAAVPIADLYAVADAQVVAELLAGHLGTAERRELFCALAEDFSGPFGELLDAVDAVAAVAP